VGRGLVAGVLLAGLGGLAGCGDGNPRSTERYCADLAEQADQLNVDLVTLDDAEQLVDRYERFAERAPVAVADAWRQLADLVQAAAAVDLDDPAARSVVVEQAASTERATTEIVEHALAVCGVTLLTGPPPAATTTIDPASTTTVEPPTATTTDPATTTTAAG